MKECRKKFLPCLRISEALLTFVTLELRFHRFFDHLTSGTRFFNKLIFSVTFRTSKIVPTPMGINGKKKTNYSPLPNLKVKKIIIIGSKTKHSNLGISGKILICFQINYLFSP